MTERGKNKDEMTKAELRKIRAEIARQKKQTKSLLIGTLIIIIAIGTALSVNMLSSPQIYIETEDTIENENEVKIPLSKVDDGEIHYYTSEGTTFYVHQNPQENIHTRISLCEPCVGKTFTLLEGGTIVDCDECHTRWDSETYEGIYPEPGEVRSGVTITTEEIGCENYPPSYLPSTVIDDYVVIEKKDLVG